MIPWATREAALVAVLTACLADQAPRPLVTWERKAEAAAFVSPASKAAVYLANVSKPNIGRPDIVRVYTPAEDPEDEADPTLAGTFSDQLIRHMRWIVRVRVESFDARAATQAFAWCETMRTRLYRESSLVALRAAGIGLEDLTDVTDLSRTIDNRWTPVASFDLRMNTTDEDLDVATYPDIRVAQFGAVVDEINLGIVGTITFGDEDPSVEFDPSDFSSDFA